MSASRQPHARRSRRRLATLLSEDVEPSVVEAALWIAAEHYPELSPERYVRRLQQLASEGARRAGDLDNPFARLDSIRTLLFEEIGYRGNLQSYDDPRNSFLNEVLDRRLGIPLTLSILYIEVAHAAGFGARGIALPGHFVVRIEREGRTLFVDPFHGGRIVSEEDCRDLVTRTTGRASLFRRDLLRGTSRRATVARLLLNLKHVYLGRRDYANALTVVDRLLLVSPGDRNEIRDRGLLQAHLGRPAAAIEDLETYLSLAPGAPDVDSVAGRLRRLRKLLPEVD